MAPAIPRQTPPLSNDCIILQSLAHQPPNFSLYKNITADMFTITGITKPVVISYHCTASHIEVLCHPLYLPHDYPLHL